MKDDVDATKDLESARDRIDRQAVKVSPRVAHYLQRARSHIDEAIASLLTADHTARELPFEGLTDKERGEKLAKESVK